MKSYLYISVFLFIFVAVGSYYSRINGWYGEFWFTDVILHTLSGVMFACVFLWIFKNSDSRNKWPYIIAAVLFSVFGSYLWEIWEYLGWKYFPERVDFYEPTLEDSLLDIFCGFIGGLIVMVVFKLRKSKSIN